MARINVNPNRMELLKLRRRAAIARRGHKLLKDKLDELMKQFLDLVRQGGSQREELERRLLEAHAAFAMAGSEMMAEELDEALAQPVSSLEIAVEDRRIMGVRVPHFEVETSGDFLCYSLSTTPLALDAALRGYRDLVPEFIRLAEVENNIARLSAEIEKTRRRVNALEYVLIPSLEETVDYITMKLDEMERSYRVQLMKMGSGL